MHSDPFGWVGHTVAGKFRVEAIVAEGGFGVVYRALHVGFDARVALKCLKLPARLQGAERDRFLEAFLAEGRLLHQLSRATAGIVQALDVGAAVSPSGVWTPYLALEWLEGVPLDAELAARARRGLPGRSLPEAVALLDSAARALALAHDQGVAHRDLKPGNLFVAEIGGKRVCKVLDFGIAKVVADLSNLARALQETGGAIQAFTPQYGAPEQFDRKYGATGPWTDVFAFALVVVEVMTGRPALDGADTTQLFVSSMRPDRRPTPRASGVTVSDATEAIFVRALAVDPGARPASMGAFWAVLVEEAVRAPVTAGAAGPVDVHAATAYGPAPTPPTAPLTPHGTPAPAASPLAASAIAPMALAATALAPTVVGSTQTGHPRDHRAAAGGPSTTAPHMAPLPPTPPPGASVPMATAVARPSRLWIWAIAGAGALVVVAAVVVAVVALRVETARTAVGSGGAPWAGGGSGAALRATAAQKLLRKDPSCMADFDAADRLDPAGTPPALEPARAYCEMLAGKCEQGRKRYRAYLVQTNPASAEGVVDAVAAQYCPREQLSPGARVLALTNDVNAAWQKGETTQCVAVGNTLVSMVDAMPDRTGAQQTSRFEAAGALSTAAQCAAKGGRCDDASTFYRTRMHVLAKQPTPAAADAAFRAAYPECAKK
jgi:serine/threonine-protein kinase